MEQPAASYKVQQHPVLALGDWLELEVPAGQQARWLMEDLAENLQSLASKASDNVVTHARHVLGEQSDKYRLFEQQADEMLDKAMLFVDEQLRPGTQLSAQAESVYQHLDNARFTVLTKEQLVQLGRFVDDLDQLFTEVGFKSYLNGQEMAKGAFLPDDPTGYSDFMRSMEKILEDTFEKHNSHLPEGTPMHDLLSRLEVLEKEQGPASALVDAPSSDPIVQDTEVVLALDNQLDEADSYSGWQAPVPLWNETGMLFDMDFFQAIA